MTEETLEKLAQLLEQDQFELLIPEKMRTESGRISDKASASMDIPLVYLMNDAVESFLVSVSYTHLTLPTTSRV